MRERHRRVPAEASSGLLTGFHLVHLALWIVVDHHPQRPQHRHHARRAPVQILAQVVFQQAQLDGAVGFRNADGFAEIADRLRRVAAPPDAGERGHARIVPAAHVPVLHQLQQLALAQQRVSQVQPVELDLLRMIDAQRFAEPVVQRPVVFEFQRADGVGDALDRIRLAVGVVVHRVDAPLVARCDDARRAGCGTSPGRAC